MRLSPRPPNGDDFGDWNGWRFEAIDGYSGSDFVSYLVMDLLNGQPIYEAMLDKMAIKHPTDLVEPTLIELTVGDKIAGKYVRDLKLPDNVLITTQIHNKNHKWFQVARASYPVPPFS